MRCTDKTKSKLTQATLITPTGVHPNKQSIETRCNSTNISFEATARKLIFRYYNILAAGLHQVMQPEMGVILQVTDGEIRIFTFGVIP